MNQNGSRKVLNWKLSIQHFNFFIEHIKGVDNIPADVFSRLVPRTGLIVNNIVLSRCTTRQHDLIKACHEHHYAHWGVQKTLNLLKSYHPEETSKDLWSNIFARCARLHAMLPHLSKNDSVTSGYQSTPVCVVYGITDDTNSDRYYRSIPNRHGFLSYNRHNRHLQPIH